MIRFNCKNCGHRLKIPDQHAGKKGKCPECKQLIVIPAAGEESTQAASIIKFRCPNCGQKIGVTTDYAGKRVKCAKCKNPMLVPQLSTQAGPSDVKGQTEVLRAGHEQRPAEENAWQDIQNLDAQMFEEAPPIDTPEEPGPDDYETEEDQSPEDSGSFPGQETEEQAGISRKVIFIIAGCVAGFVLLGIVVAFILAGSDSGQSQVQLPIAQVQEFVERYIDMLENGEIDEARQSLSPGLENVVENSQIEGFAEQITKSRIIKMDCLRTHSEQHPEGYQFFLWYNLGCEDGVKNVIVSVLQIEQELTIDGIAARDSSGLTVSIGQRSFNGLSQMAATTASKRFRAFFSKFFIGFMLVILPLAILIIVSHWIVYEKAGYPGWASIVPFYNMWVLAEIGGKSGWMGLAMCFTGLIPYVGGIIGLVLSLIISIGVARSFDRGIAFGIGLCLLPIVFYPILAFARD